MSAGYMRRCAGKKRHETEKEADKARRGKASEMKVPVSRYAVYSCDQCGGWHEGEAGHRMQTRRRRPGKRLSKKMRGRM